MSYFDIRSSTDINLVSQFLIERLSLGHFLRYADYQIIQRWLDESEDIEQLLLVIEEVVPIKEKNERFSIKSLEKQILNRLKQQT